MVRSMCRLLAVSVACLISSLIEVRAEPQPVEYVRVCSLYGAGFYYIPGTDTCLRLSGRPRTDLTADQPDWGWNVSGLGYLASHKAESFDNKYDTGSFGWNVSGGLRLPNYIRLQVDTKGETTGPYCDNCGHSSYWAVGGHVSWNPVSNFGLGVLGGYVHATPTFDGPISTYDFWGGEARYFTNTWMVGAQVGRLDVRDGPGSLTDAWFAEARFILALRALIWRARALDDEKTKFDKVVSRTSISLRIGHAEGDYQNTTFKAESTQWSISLNYRWTPGATSFIAYEGIENKREPVGKVWTDNAFKLGMKIDWATLGATARIEPNTPLPMVLGALTRF
jgi:hypothetical protein